MRSRKGQGVIIEILAFAMSLMLAMFVFIVLISTGSVTEHRVSESINFELAELRKRSVISLTMNDKMWRAEGINRGKYSGWPAYKVISYYFSTKGDYVHIYENRIDRETVEDDIETYLNHKMEKYWQDGPNDVGYLMNVSNPESGQEPLNITVRSYSPDATGSRISYPISKSEGETMEVALWTNKSGSIYSVSTGGN
jgi:hypothetical protein